MECKVGDRVRFMDDIGGGIVAKFIDKKTVAVRDEDGFEIPVSLANIVVVQSDDFFQREKTRDRSVPVEPAALTTAIASENPAPTQEETPNTALLGRLDPIEGDTLSFYLAFLPGGNELNDFEVFLINDAAYRSFVVLSEYRPGNVSKALFAGFIEPDTKLKVLDLPQTYFRKEMDWGLSFLPFKNVPYQYILPDTADIHLNPLKFFRQGCFQTNDFFDEDALVLQIYDSAKAE